MTLGPYRTPSPPAVRTAPWWEPWLVRIVGPVPLRYGARLNAFRWYRRWCGGHWEQWWIDVPIVDVFWFDRLVCTHRSGRAPCGLARGTPVCEHWDTAADAVPEPHEDMCGVEGAA